VQISRIGQKRVLHGWILYTLGGVDNCVVDLQAETLKIEAQSMHGLDFEREDYGLAFHLSKAQDIVCLHHKNAEPELQKLRDEILEDLLSDHCSNQCAEYRRH
jgi:hypothetical protein